MIYPLLVLLLSLHDHLANADGPLRRRNDYPTCGNCWCIPSSQDTCPDWEPVESYSKDIMRPLAKQTPVNPYRLDCDPYVYSPGCTTTPPQTHVDEEGAVCALIYDEPKRKFFDCDRYKMFTYTNYTDAEVDGAFVTHTGACGVCSTTEDLAAMMDPKFEDNDIQCILNSGVDYRVGLKCYLKIGFSLSCARLYVAQAVASSSACSKRCAAEKAVYNPDPVPLNGPPPTCLKSDCLQCIETAGGSTFMKFAGRTKKRSGLLSTVIRHCDGFPDITHEACPIDKEFSNIFDTETIE